MSSPPPVEVTCGCRSAAPPCARLKALVASAICAPVCEPGMASSEPVLWLSTMKPADPALMTDEDTGCELGMILTSPDSVLYSAVPAGPACVAYHGFCAEVPAAVAVRGIHENLRPPIGSLV